MNENCSHVSSRAAPKVKNEKNEENGYGIGFSHNGAIGQSPSSVKFYVKSCHLEFASPSHRSVAIVSSQSENEVEWDLTSPSAHKYFKDQMIFSDKKSSTPKRSSTPSRTRERPRRPTLCKKNIAKSNADNSCSSNLFSELAALNELVNLEQAHSIQKDEPCSVEQKSMPQPYHEVSLLKDLSNSDVFSDDSFSFTDSILLSTQALEDDALTNANLNAKKSISTNSVQTPTVSLSEQRRLFSTCSVDSICNTSSNSSNLLKEQSSSYTVPVLKDLCPVDCDMFTQPKETMVLKPPIGSKAKSSSSQPRHLNMLAQCQVSPLTKSQVMKCTVGSPHRQRISNTEAAKRQIGGNEDLLDDSFDDLLCAVAEQVENQYVKKATPVKRTSPLHSTLETEEDDDLCQPEVLEWISQIESQALTLAAKPNSMAVEEKRQEAIRRRKQRIQNVNDDQRFCK